MGVEEAMAQLDTNKDGTCSFDEFKELWSSKSGLGGYNSFTLKFLKGNVKAQSLLEKGRKLFGNASGFVGGTEPTQDTVVTVSSEVSPGGQPFAEKMAIDFKLKQVDEGAGDASPIFKIKLSANTADDGDKVRAAINTALEPFREIMEMMSIDLNIGGEGTTVEASVAPPAGVIEMAYQEEDMMKVLIPIVKSLKNSSCRWSCGNLVEDLIASPDKAMPLVFAGSKCESTMYQNAEGKRIALSNLPRKSHPKTKILAEFGRLFAGAEIQVMYGFHQKNLESAMNFVPDEIQPLLTPEGLKSMIETKVNETLSYTGSEELQQMSMFIDAGNSCIDKLSSIDEISFDNIDLPADFAGGVPGTLGGKITCTNVKPFGVIKYFGEPLLQNKNIKEFATVMNEMETNETNDCDNKVEVEVIRLAPDA